MRRGLPARRWALSADLRLAPGAVVALRSGPVTVTVSRRGTSLVVRADRGRMVIPLGRPRSSGDWRRIELTPAGATKLAVDGVVVDAPSRWGDSIAISPRRGTTDVEAIIATDTAPARLLLHRLAALKSRTPPRRFPLGTGSDGRIRFAAGWTRGFWPGALWQAADNTQADLFRGWAIDATEDNLGAEWSDTHDLGFMYERSSVAAYRRLCRDAGAEGRECARLRASALAAAETLLGLLGTNSAAGAIPTQSFGCVGCNSPDLADTIVDSMMNVPLLIWAGSETGRPEFRGAAARHARTVARWLVRDDGSTAQSVHFDRATGQVREIHTHQGLGPESTWARGQAWSLYGFAVTGGLLRDRDLVHVAERNAAYVERKLPVSGIPPWDYDAAPGAAPDVSAGVITAAALFRLADVCERVRDACTGADRWRPLARRMLDAALERTKRQAPLGFLGDQVYVFGGRYEWDDSSELVFGLDYALEAVNNAGRPGR